MSCPTTGRVLPATPHRRCPVCDGDHKCSATEDGLILCGRRQGDQPGFRHLGPCQDDTWHMYRPSEESRGAGERGSRGEKTPAASASFSPAPLPPCSPADLARDFERALSESQQEKLAAAIGLPFAALNCLPGLGFDADKGCWTIPERDGHGQIIGIATRFPDGTKRAVPNSKRGLTVTSGWADHPGPIVVVEGMSDAVALAWVGISAVGRPSNTGGGDHLVALIRQLDSTRPVIVLGENDRKPTGDWPGKTGADKVAAHLRQHLKGWAVLTALPPDGFKDARAWVLARLQAMTSTTISAQQKAKAVGVEIRDLLARAAVAAPPAVVAAPCPYPARRKLSELVRDAGGHGWLWDGYVARGRVTLFASDPKCGKTTFLSHMYRQMAAGGEFCGRPLLPGKVLIVTEETDDDWIDRRDFLHIGDHVETLPVPFFGKPTHDEWAGFLAHIGTTFDADPVDVLVFDTLANMWPVKDENSAAEVGQALMPAKRLAAGRAVILVHHCRKSGGDDGAAIRGSSAFGGAVDQIVTFTRQSKAVDPHGRRREIHANGRMRGTPAEWVVELSADEQTMVKAAGGPGGDATGGRTDALRDAILAVLPSDGDGWTRDEIWDALPDAVRKNQVRLKSVLEAEAGRLWEKNGDGTKKAAYRYRLAAPPGE